MLQFRASREEGHAFPSREAYLERQTGAPFYGERRLCNAIAKVNLPLSNWWDASNPGDKWNEQSLHGGFPWLTFVVGSGCLDARSITDDQLEAAPERMRALLSQHRFPHADVEPGEIARDFACSLIEDRLGKPIPRASDMDKTETAAGARALDVWTAKVVLLSALLTQLYYRSKATVPEATSRWGNDFAEVGDGRRYEEIKIHLLQPALDLVQALLERPAKDATLKDRVLNQVLAEIRKDLHPSDLGRSPRLAVMNLKVLTELAWYLLTEGSLVYPGWSDLLLDLSLHGGVSPLRHGQPRPAFRDADDPRQLIEHRYHKVTHDSWKRLRECEGSEPSGFYESAAEILRRQADLRAASKSKHLDRPPIASAFVTTFDLELEMALLAHPDRKPFVVAIPVYLFQGRQAQRQRLASLCWLGCLVRPEADPNLEGLTKPQEWFVLSRNSYYIDREHEGVELAKVPHVVRLSGCPLIDLPAVSEEPGNLHPDRLRETVFAKDIARDDFDDDSPQDLDIVVEHALLLDEYAAMQQNRSDSYLNATQETEDEDWYGLPSAITGVETPEWISRYWAVMGVQMGDSGVRYRLTSHLLPRLTHDVREPSNDHVRGGGEANESRARDLGDVRPARSGIVVNLRLDAAEQDFLYWFGFDVIIDECEKFIDDFRHYAKHLTPPLSQRVEPSKECGVGG